MAFYSSLHLCSAVFRNISPFNSICLFICLSAPPQTICMYSHPHTHFLFFSIGDEIWRSHRRGSLRPLIPNISLLCLNLIQVVAGWQRGNFLWDWADARDALRWYSFQVSPQQPIRSFLFITHDRPGRETRDRKRRGIQKLTFLLRIK